MRWRVYKVRSLRKGERGGRERKRWTVGGREKERREREETILCLCGRQRGPEKRPSKV